jgi:hypothetical protein
LQAAMPESEPIITNANTVLNIVFFMFIDYCLMVN